MKTIAYICCRFKCTSNYKTLAHLFHNHMANFAHSTSVTLETKLKSTLETRELMKYISAVSASYEGLTFPELSLPTRAAQQRSNGISRQRSPASPGTGSPPSSERATGALARASSSPTRHPASASQGKGKCNRHRMQVFGGRITTVICSHHLPSCGYPRDRNHLGKLLQA